MILGKENVVRLILHGNEFDETVSLRVHAVKQLNHVLWRFAGQIRSVHVQLAAFDEPHGRIRKHCRIEVTGQDPWTVALLAVDSDPYLAVDRAAQHLARSVPRTIRRFISYGVPLAAEENRLGKISEQ